MVKDRPTPPFFQHTRKNSVDKSPLFQPNFSPATHTDGFLNHFSPILNTPAARTQNLVRNNRVKNPPTPLFFQHPRKNSVDRSPLSQPIFSPTTHTDSFFSHFSPILNTPARCTQNLVRNNRVKDQLTLPIFQHPRKNSVDKSPLSQPIFSPTTHTDGFLSHFSPVLNIGSVN